MTKQKKQKQDWEKEFDELWRYAHKDEIKQFISNLLQKQKEEIRKEVEEEKQPFKVSENMEQREKHNSILKDILKIKSLKL